MLGYYAGVIKRIKIGESSGEMVSKFIGILLICFGIIGLIYISYILFLKDCILILREKRRKTVVESGFGESNIGRTAGGGGGVI